MLAAVSNLDVRRQADQMIDLRFGICRGRPSPGEAGLEPPMPQMRKSCSSAGGKFLFAARMRWVIMKIKKGRDTMTEELYNKAMQCFDEALTPEEALALAEESGNEALMAAVCVRRTEQWREAEKHLRAYGNPDPEDPESASLLVVTAFALFQHFQDSNEKRALRYGRAVTDNADYVTDVYTRGCYLALTVPYIFDHCYDQDLNNLQLLQLMQKAVDCLKADTLSEKVLFFAYKNLFEMEQEMGNPRWEQDLDTAAQLAARVYGSGSGIYKNLVGKKAGIQVVRDEPAADAEDGSAGEETEESAE